jgi:PAS domain S-box-containing protein
MSSKNITTREEKTPALATEADALRLVHELQVRQMELEMQNEELKRARSEIEELLGQYADLYDFAPVGYFTLSSNGVILQANLSGARLLGVERENLIEQRFALFVSAESQPVFNAFLERVLGNHGKETCEAALLKNRHETIWARIEATYSDTLHEQRRICRIMASDITENKRAEDILQARFRITEFAANHSLADLLQNALDELCALTASPVGFFHFVEPDGRTLSLQAWSTRTLKEMCTAEGKGSHYDIDKAGVWVDCVREGRPVIHNDYASLPHRKGLPAGHAPMIREMIFPIIRDQKIMAIIGVGNKPSDYVEGDMDYALRLADLIWDITERKRAEAQREVALEALRESEARYRSILEDQTELICRYLPDGRLSYVNEAYARYYSESALKLINTNFIPNIPEPDISMVIGKIAEITPQEPVAVYEHRIIKPDGEIRWQRWTHRGIYNAMGELIEHQAVGSDITERKQAQETLRLSELDLNQAQAVAHIGSWRWDIKSGEVSWSDEMYRIFGVDKNSHTGRLGDVIAKVVHPEDLHLVLPSNARAFADKEPIEYRILLPDGSMRHILAKSGDVVYDNEGSPILLMGIAQDVTERKQAEDQIQLLAKFPAEDPNPILRVARDGILMYINESGLNLLRQWNLRVGEAVPSALQEAVFQSMQNGTTQTLDIERDERLYAFYVAPIVSSGYANLYCHDITESRQVKALRDAETRYRILFEQSPYGVLLVDPETGATVEANDITSRQLGYTRAEFLTLKISDYEASEDLEQITQHMQKVIAEGNDDFETLHRTKTGEIRNVHAWVKTLRLKDRVFFYTIFQDITERKRMMEANEAYRREITLLEERQRIASDLHDAVSQTLFSLRLNAETLLRQPDRQSDVFTHSLIDLNRLTRSASGELRLLLFELRNNALLNVNLNTLLTNLIDSGMARTNANLVFQCFVDDLVLPAQVKLAFYRIAQEAISNAIKHGKPANIHCVLRDDARMLEMIIQDDGMGFSIETASDDHFGLQIMHERAEQAGVELSIAAQPGGGTSVTVRWKKAQ